MGTPQEWLARARGNLAIARLPKPAEAVWDDLCFEAQQAAEKAVKAVLLAYGIEFPFIHDLGELLVLLRRHGRDVPGHLWAADELSEYATAARYPGHPDCANEDDYRRALTLADQIVRWAEGIVHGG